jgi:hypothetical protein
MVMRATSMTSRRERARANRLDPAVAELLARAAAARSPGASYLREHRALSLAPNCAPE